MNSEGCSLRKTASYDPPGLPPLFEGEDYRVLRERKYIGRIYRMTGRDDWFWLVSASIPATEHHGMAASRDNAVAQLEAALTNLPKNQDQDG